MVLSDNPLATASELPHEYPAFDRIKDEHILPAIEAGIAEQIEEINQITANPEAPTFENTVVALERSGQLLERGARLLFALDASDTNPIRQELRSTLAPKLAAHSDAINLNADLYQRVRAVFDQRDELGLDGESAWLLERTHTEFVRAGANLTEDKQQRLRELNEELATLKSEFQDKLLADTNDLAVLVDDVAELDGLSEDAIASAAEAAAGKGQPGKYLLTLSLFTAQPALASLNNRKLRERLYTASISRCNRNNNNDTKDLVLRISALRAENAALFGYQHRADYVIADETARTAEAAKGLLDRLAPAAVANAKVEEAELQQLLEQDEPGAKLEPWDWPYYAEKVRKNRFEVDDAVLRPYFELDRVIHDGVFYAANRLYGLTFTERFDLPKYHPDNRVFEVFDHDGTSLGMFIGDYYTRESKNGGAWMFAHVLQSHLFGHGTVVTNDLNIPKPSGNEPTLLTFDEVNTLFHEFGHALHGLLSDVRYSSLSGTNVPRDFVEFPSQVNEMWMLWPEVLANYAKHYQTGEPLPQQLVDRLLESRQYGEGFSTTEYLGAALLDQAWHHIGPDEKVIDVVGFEKEALLKSGLDMTTVRPRYSSTYFQHVFSHGYQAAYYAYIWSEVLDADTVEWFTENGGLTRENGERFRRELLAKGGSMDSMTAYRNFRGRDPKIEPLLKRRGLTAS